MMHEIFDVNTGQVAVKNGKVLLRAMAIGSCIAVAAYDALTKNAGLAHIMLPGQAPKGSCECAKYASDGIEQLLDQMAKSGSSPETLAVCLVGAGNVLRKPDDTICPSNIQSVTAILAAKNIPVQAAVLGGYDRKGIVLDAENGTISYTKGDDPVRLLWQSQS
jgi:chemotaxis protein CheD